MLINKMNNISIITLYKRNIDIIFYKVKKKKIIRWSIIVEKVTIFRIFSNIIIVY